jgi:hypothetical protein
MFVYLQHVNRDTNTMKKKQYYWLTAFASSAVYFLLSNDAGIGLGVMYSLLGKALYD